MYKPTLKSTLQNAFRRTYFPPSVDSTAKLLLFFHSCKIFTKKIAIYVQYKHKWRLIL